MKKLTNTLFAVFVLISFCSCIKSDLAPEPCPGSIDGGEDALIYLQLRTPKGFTTPPASRALTFNQENEINDIYVLVFDNTNSLVAIKEGQEVTGTPGSSTPGYSGEGSFTVTLAASQNSSDTYNLVVLANAADLLASTIGTDETSTYIGNSYAEVAAAIYGSISDKMYGETIATDDAAIPMWGESDALVIEPGKSNKTLDLTRAIARIDVGIGVATKTGNTWSWSGLDADDEPIPFRLGHVYVMRPNDKYAVMPDPEAEAGTPHIPAGTTAFSAEDSEDIFGYTATASDAGGFISQEIYVPESDILMEATGEMGDANHTNRMAIVVGGFYDGSSTETFYRLDFAVNKLLINVLRNHLYQFSISQVSGSGFPDVETAYESQAMNMSVNIYDWNATDMTELFLDGSKYVMLGQSENDPNNGRIMTVFRDAGSQDKIEMRTNIPLSEFALELNNGGTFPDEGNLMVIQNERFKVELKTENSTNYFVVTALQPYADAANNPSVLTVTTGRITFDITIRQVDSDPGDWYDGGPIDQDLDKNE